MHKVSPHLADANAKGYDFTTGGVSLGIDYRITDQLAVGLMGDYSHTWTSLEPNDECYFYLRQLRWAAWAR